MLKLNMKTTALFFIAAAFILTSCGGSNQDSVKQAHEQNLNSAIDEEISEFMTEAADARMMNIEQGKLAKEKGSTAAVRQYGEWMISDQTRLLKELRILAAEKNIMLPSTLSNKKAKALEDLREKEGEKFDKEFIQMMTIDHRRDVRGFDDATDFKDKDIQKFATTNLPMIQSHLDKIRQIEDAGAQNVTETSADSN
jgi:putative membrane protein